METCGSALHDGGEILNEKVHLRIKILCLLGKLIYDNGVQQGISEDNLSTLRAVHNLVNNDRLEESILKDCLSVLTKLHSECCNVLSNEDQEKIIKQPKDCTNNTKSSEVFSVLCVDSEISTFNTNYSITLLNDQLKRDFAYLKSIIKKFPEKIHNDNSSRYRSSKNNDLSLDEINLPNFSESRLRLNKIMGFVSISKEPVSELNAMKSEIAKEIRDMATKKSLNDNNEIIGIKHIEPPPTYITNLEEIRDESISSFESNDDDITHHNISTYPYSQSNLNLTSNAVNSSNEPEQKLSLNYISTSNNWKNLTIENSKKFLVENNAPWIQNHYVGLTQRAINYSNQTNKSLNMDFNNTPNNWYTFNKENPNSCKFKNSTTWIQNQYDDFAQTTMNYSNHTKQSLNINLNIASNNWNQFIMENPNNCQFENYTPWTQNHYIRNHDGFVRSSMKYPNMYEKHNNSCRDPRLKNKFKRVHDTKVKNQCKTIVTNSQCHSFRNNVYNVCNQNNSNKLIVNTNDGTVKDLQISHKMLNYQSNIIKKNINNIDNFQKSITEKSTKKACKFVHPKQHSKDNEPNIISEEQNADMSSENYLCGSRIETISLMNKEGIQEKVGLNDLEKVSITTDNEKKIITRSENKNINIKCEGTENSGISTEERENKIIATPIQVADEGSYILSNERKENNISLSSAAEIIIQKYGTESWKTILQNIQLLSRIPIFQDNSMLEKLNILLNHPEFENLINNKSKNNDKLNKDHSISEELKKKKKKLKKGKKKEQIVKNKEIERLFNNDSKNKHFNQSISDKDKSDLDDSNGDDISSFGNNHDHVSSYQSKCNSSEPKKKKKNYGHFKIISKHGKDKGLKFIFVRLNNSKESYTNLDLNLSSNTNTQPNQPSTLIESRVDYKTDTEKNTTKPKKKQKNELDLLHGQIREMYDVKQLLNLPNIRRCRTNKIVNYTNKVVSKKAVDIDKSQVIKKKSTLKTNKKTKLEKNKVYGKNVNAEKFESHPALTFQSNNGPMTEIISNVLSQNGLLAVQDEQHTVLKDKKTNPCTTTCLQFKEKNEDKDSIDGSSFEISGDQKNMNAISGNSSILNPWINNVASLNEIKVEDINKKKFEVAPLSNIDVKLFPQHVPIYKRFKCSKPCTFLGKNMASLRNHFLNYHSNVSIYLCPHCSCVKPKNEIEFHLSCHDRNLYKCQYCDYIGCNRIEMMTHLKNLHDRYNENQPCITIIREKGLNYIVDKLRHEKAMIQSQALTSIEPSLMAKVPPQFEREKKTSNSKETIKDQFSKNYSFETLAADGLFKCPKCNVFTSKDVDNFRHHLFNEINDTM